MDARHFDLLTKSLTATTPRRRLLRLLATLPLLGGLLALLELDDAEARGRRKRRKKAHKHGKPSGRHRKGKRKCSAQPLTKGTLRRDLFEGFNFDREQNVEKSAKDAFASLASASGAVPATKSEAESWFNANVKSGMEELGHKVDWVKGDKFQFSNWQGSWVVDFVRGADGPNPAFTWLADPAGASFT